MKILETERLVIRELDSAIDAEFIFELLNTPKFIKHIGDRGVRSAEQAAAFIDDRYRASYREHGYGLYVVELRRPANNVAGTLLNSRVSARTPIGICGFVKREQFEFPDIGFAFLPEYERHGYGFESASAVIGHGRELLGFTRLLAVTSQDNDVSGKLLEKLGFRFDKVFITAEGEELKLFEKDL